MKYVYMMKSKEGEILYIGVTQSMVERMSVHFCKNRSASAIPEEGLKCIHSI